MLGARSAKLVDAHPNTGVRIEGKTALRGVIVLEKRVSDDTCLEIVALGYEDPGRTRPLSIDDERDKY